MAQVLPPQVVRWWMVVTIAGVDVSTRLTGAVRVELEAGTARIAEFSLRPVSQVIALSDWLGTTVTIDYVRAGTPHRVFTGVVSLPVLDPDTRVVRFHCTDNRQKKLEALGREAIDTLLPGSLWSPDVFDEEAGGFRYAEDRLTTLPARLDLARDGSTWRLTPWALNAGATDFEFAQVVHQSLSVETPGLADLVNEVIIEFDYRYVRRRHRERHWHWLWENWNGDWGFCFWFADTTELPDKDMIRAAAERGGWTPDPLSFTWVELPPSDPDPCNTGVGWINAGFPTVLGATWKAAYRTSQYVTENYQLTVRAPQSIAQHGTQSVRERGAAETQHDLEGWETDPAVGVPGRLRAGQSGGLDPRLCGPHPDESGHRDDAGPGAGAHPRQPPAQHGHVRLAGPRARLDAGSAVEVQALGVHAKGRVAQLIETFDIERETVRSTIRVAVSRAGADIPVEETPLVAPEPPATSVPRQLKAAALVMQPTINGVALEQGGVAPPAWFDVMNTTDMFGDFVDNGDGTWSTTSFPVSMIYSRLAEGSWFLDNSNAQMFAARMVVSFPSAASTELEAEFEVVGRMPAAESPMIGPYSEQTFNWVIADTHGQDSIPVWHFIRFRLAPAIDPAHDHPRDRISGIA
jgi:hypothetical protein